jgi:hypothetical protein
VALNIRSDYRFPFRRPKELLKRALVRHAPHVLAYRKKLGFGQPIFEWMALGGQLRPLIEKIGIYSFVDKQIMASACVQPTWFLYTLLCYDLWYKLFIEKKQMVNPSEPAMVL